MSGPLVLGIETSCDETGVGIVRGTELLANVIASSMDEHARFGGVVPEIAARAHLEALESTLHAAVEQAGIALTDLDAVAVTSGPGLSGALMVGVGAAKALALALDRPFYAVNHLVGHVGADILHDPGAVDRGELELPTIALLVSGGHTSLLLVRSLTDDVELLGETIDDAAGEAFDKVARLLGLPYPGGPQIDRVAADGDPTAVRFPRGLTLPKDLVAHRYDFSFSGLKTAVARHVEKLRDAGEPGVRRPRRAAAAARRGSRRQRARPHPRGRARRRGGREPAHPAALALHRQRSDDRRDRRPAHHGRSRPLRPRHRRRLDPPRDCRAGLRPRVDR